ncbi:hypothetical protein [Moorena sp. SIO2C4]|uniref:hypothetical protein n=1 Tax=Moorena sp. SIO2C4 TaxID=2607824 RepID=UPI0013BFAAB7|nr:hypothetical protein [Moorena sp. SIO2C4]NEQ17462.1 hypothetical protein [Moorena sp. SIO3E2]NES46620.1 hypothetical protein [Moorena sp. SIO2C4]
MRYRWCYLRCFGSVATLHRTVYAQAHATVCAAPQVAQSVLLNKISGVAELRNECAIIWFC